MKQKIDARVPRYGDLIMPTFIALKELGGSGSNSEIYDQVIHDLNLSDEIVDIPHLGSTNMSELQYQLAWARTYLKNYSAIENSARAVWSVLPAFVNIDSLDPQQVILATTQKSALSHNKQAEPASIPESPEDSNPQNDAVEYPDEAKPWRAQLSEILHSMDPFAFERLSQRLLRECGFSQVTVTKKTGDGGIDGTGKLKINGIFSFNVAFQCKRYQGMVGAPAIRDFRGSLTTDIEKGVLLTTGTFSKAARDEAANPGKQQIDLIDGEDFISKLAEYNIGVTEIKTYKVDESFFQNI